MSAKKSIQKWVLLAFFFIIFFWILGSNLFEFEPDPYIIFIFFNKTKWNYITTTIVVPKHKVCLGYHYKYTRLVNIEKEKA